MTPSKSQIIKAGAGAFFRANPITTIVGGAVIVFIGYRLIKKWTSPGQNIPVVPPIPPTPDQPTEPEQKKYTYLSQQYADFADAIAEACSGPGTYEEDIEQVMKKMMTKADVLALINAYGRRAITSPWGWDTDPMTLSQTLKYELSADYLDRYVNQPLRRTGYKF